MNVKVPIPNRTYFILMACALLASCQSYKPGVHEFPTPEDTYTKPVEFQEKTAYRFDGVYADNEFDGARMNGFRQVNDTTFRVIVSPENTPINESAYYAFRLRSERPREIDLEIEYTEHPHRYIPKLSYDGRLWTAMDSSQFDTLKAGNLVTLRLSLDERQLYVAGQELMTSSDASAWLDSLAATHSYIRTGIAGQSKLGRNIRYMSINQQEDGRKGCIAILSRLHPPEVTGYMAMKAFTETLLEDNVLANLFRQRYRVIVYPMVNPDGVDLGHWRHNAGGVDLNRDWAEYRQKETRVVAEHLVRLVRKSHLELAVGLDFHSTQEDIYYTLSANRKSHVHGFKDLWLFAIDKAFDNYTPNDAPFDLDQPISKGWFYLEFGAEGITYEVGDETPRDFIREKARLAATEMMKLLVLR